MKNRSIHKIEWEQILKILEVLEIIFRIFGRNSQNFHFEFLVLNIIILLII
jgi:hypothetical protein